MTENYKDEVKPYWLKEALLSSERLGGASVNITNTISDIEIYEDLFKPYLTGRVAFVDYNKVVESINLGGDEKIKFTINKPGSDYDIVRTFYLDSLINSTKGNEATESYFFHMIEDIEYEGNTVNINKFYEGKPSTIISNILKEYTGSDLTSIDITKESSEPLKVIIPNLDPIDSISWLRKKAITAQGMPYFLYASLGPANRIYFNDLGTLLSRPSINIEKSFKAWQSGTQEEGTSSGNFQIVSSKVQRPVSLYDLIMDASVGASHQFYDTVNGKEKVVDLNIEESLKTLDKTGILSKAQRDYIYPTNSTINNEQLSSLKSTKRFTYPSNRPYEQGFTTKSSFAEFTDRESYTKKVVGLALLNFLQKNKMTVTVPGTNFIKGDDAYTVGNVATFKFLNNTGEQTEDIPLDRKKSGDYLITNCIHIFKPENYYITMEISKLQHYLGDELS
jgi:hypothetical protein